MLRLLLPIAFVFSLGLSSCREAICNCEMKDKRPYKSMKVKYKKTKNGGYKRYSKK